MLAKDKVRFGTELRASPFKRGTTRFLSTQVSSQPVRRGLNFSGEQRERVDSFTRSSSLNGDKQQRTSARHDGSAKQAGQGEGAAPSAKKTAGKVAGSGTAEEVLAHRV